MVPTRVSGSTSTRPTFNEWLIHKSRSKPSGEPFNFIWNHSWNKSSCKIQKNASSTWGFGCEAPRHLATKYKTRFVYKINRTWVSLWIIAWPPLMPGGWVLLQGPSVDKFFEFQIQNGWGLSFCKNIFKYKKSKKIYKLETKSKFKGRY